MRSEKIRKLAIIAMLCALAYIVMLFRTPPIFLPFLRYEAKDVVIAIGGFLFGPISALMMSILVALVEMITATDTGPFGAIMNALTSSTFACTAALIYKYRKTLSGAAIGLAAGIAITVPVALLWNYLIVPLYMANTSRADVLPLLVSAFLPFNLIKYGLSAALAMVVYKPLRIALDKSRLLPLPSDGTKAASKINIGVLLVSMFVIATCVLYILSVLGVI